MKLCFTFDFLLSLQLSYVSLFAEALLVKRCLTRIMIYFNSYTVKTITVTILHRKLYTVHTPNCAIKKINMFVYNSSGHVSCANDI